MSTMWWQTHTLCRIVYKTLIPHNTNAKKLSYCITLNACLRVTLVCLHVYHNSLSELTPLSCLKWAPPRSRLNSNCAQQCCIMHITPYNKVLYIITLGSPHDAISICLVWSDVGGNWQFYHSTIPVLHLFPPKKFCIFTPNCMWYEIHNTVNIVVTR